MDMQDIDGNNSTIQEKDLEKTGTAVQRKNTSMFKLKKTRPTLSKKCKFFCSECEFSTEKEQSLRIHMKAGHSKELYDCDRCSKVFRFPKNLKIHQTHIHKGDYSKELYNCDRCSKVFHSPRNLKIHQTRTHKEDQKPQKIHKDDQSAKKNSLKKNKRSNGSLSDEDIVQSKGVFTENNKGENKIVFHGWKPRQIVEVPENPVQNPFAEPTVKCICCYQKEHRPTQQGLTSRVLNFSEF